MARDLTTPMLAQTTAGYVCPIVLVSIAFASATSYIWSGVGDLTWNSQTWKGVGDLGKVSNVSESGDLQAEGITISLSAISNDLLADSLTEVQIGRPVYVYLGFLDSNMAVVADPYCLYKGMVDVPNTKVGPSESTFSIKVENRLIDMQRNSSLRLDSETQRRMYTGDSGMDFVSQLVDSAWAWQ